MGLYAKFNISSYIYIHNEMQWSEWNGCKGIRLKKTRFPISFPPDSVFVLAHGVNYEQDADDNATVVQHTLHWQIILMR